MVCLHTGTGTGTMGVHPACFLIDGQGYSPPRPGIPPETTPPILHILPLIAHQLASARGFFGRHGDRSDALPLQSQVFEEFAYLGGTPTDASQLLDSVARLGNRTHRCFFERRLDDVTEGGQLADGLLDARMPQPVQSAFAVRVHVSLHG